MKRAAPCTIAVALVLAGCEAAPLGTASGVRRPLMWLQSALVPHGPVAESIAALSWAMFLGGGVILVGVMVLAIVAAVRPRSVRWMGSERAVIALGIVFPVVVLSALLVGGLLLSRSLGASTAGALRIEVTGERWWWRVLYPDRGGTGTFVTANEIRIPAGRPVELVVRAADVIHSFWVPSLAGKIDMIPGHVNRIVFSASRPGVYRGQCAEYCGAQHALMAFYVVAEEPREFDAWLARQKEPAREPATPLLDRGRALFVSNGCGSCHAIRGTAAAGTLGPDLTHVGGRVSIGAGTFPNNIGTLAGWISSAQHLKPDNLMPSFGNLRGEELRALAAYLASLK